MGAVVSVAHAYDRDTFLKSATTLDAFADASAQTTSFLEQLFEDALEEDMGDVPLDDALKIVADFWHYGEHRPGDQVLIRVRNAQGAKGEALPRDVLEIIGPDRPFLVDSVMGEVAAQGLDVRAMFHPIVRVRRSESGDRVDDGGRIGAESMIQVHLEPLDTASRERLEAAIRGGLSDVRDAVEDWRDMRAQMDDAIAHLESAKTGADEDELKEALAFLTWLRDDHFAFIGARTYIFDIDGEGKLVKKEPTVLPDSGRGILRDPARHVLRDSAEPVYLAPAFEAFLNQPSPVIVAKANIKSRVHRRAYLDYVGVKRYREDGKVIGETRFVGLFTAEAYDQMARDVPLIRRKVRRVLEKAAKVPGTHSAKKLQNIVENYPRDELFQTSETDLLQMSLGILHLYDRPRTKLFMRRDQFDRFISAFLFVPRDRYNSKVREQAGELLRSAYNGRLSAFYPSFGEGPLARVHFIIGLDPHNHPEPEVLDLERRIVQLARTWEDDLEVEGRARGDLELSRGIARYLDAFTAGYRERYLPVEALDDIARMQRLAGEYTLDARAFRLSDDDEKTLRVKLYHTGEPIALSNVMPVLEHLGLHVAAEAGYPVRRENGDGPRETVWIHDFEMRADHEGLPAIEILAPKLEDAILAVLDNRAEDDGFNALVLSIGVSWREAAFLRALARYRAQSGMDPSQAIQEEALAHYPAIARQLLEIATIKFDPSLDLDLDARRAKAKEISDAVRLALEEVSSLDHDRVLRRILRLLEATLRTNFYQRDEKGQPKPWISLKIASREVRELPEPKPYREIFVWSPRVEGVHIRFGPVARGGLRWSDRREDFRTEVLGLVKAQQVKNAVIVPVGSKGGFYAKQLPKAGTREEWLAEGIESYKTFIRGLLDITDNIKGEEVLAPANVVRWDDEDPYLVVAADKGTATFSDIANGVAQNDYDFWLGDAFASGGSAGYDHKKMGITARGAWESVKRHFREMGKDIQTEDFTVIGVGDMSGDVFGNGMLLSKHIRLIAAFDHRDIFIDPNPVDVLKTWEERKRMFELPRSSWQDYNKDLISKGGGIFSRAAKTIGLTPEIKELTGLARDSVSPNELMKALLRTDVELMWFGGIGTYVKASTQQHWEVSDKANDAIRVDAGELGASVVGEGANLGMTQAARIEFERAGGHVNADFVDNSAGVDSSDHEVNIKILLNPMVRDGAMKLDDRNTLLESMTDTVADHVLDHNYDQTLALTLAQRHAREDIDAHERMMERLEADGRLNRQVEGLPSADVIRTLKEEGKGLTRPEIAILLSYAKIALFDALVACEVPDDPHFEHSLVTYFPSHLAKFEDAMQGHRLKREIIATRLANDMVNLGGPTFVHRAKESTAADTGSIARAFEAGRQIFEFSELTEAINGLDNQVSADVQSTLHDEVIRLMRRQTYWLARRGLSSGDAGQTSITAMIEAYRPGVQQLKGLVHTIISDHDRAGVEQRFNDYVEAGAPEDLARKVAELRPLTSSTDVIDLAKSRDWPLEAVARLYHAVGARFSFDRLRWAGGQLSSTLHWDRLAVRRLIEDLYASQQAITQAVINFVEADETGEFKPGKDRSDVDWAMGVVHTWRRKNLAEVERADAAIAEISGTGNWTLSKIAILSTQLRELAQIASLS
ncbi:NAD-glutamate dehydrogenase [Woodsholea maritima]|uniref:NAD-glutamate dehydrogenase n=1 Tax=Woodsholea maritima TaxID=240237 RepID=UPI0003646176|nr:NAD-glutamate dehydrogenase [Woodsholea maritima]